MFEALVMACVLMSDSDCIVFSDTRGPYQTEEQCISRVQEMAESLQQVLNESPKQFTYKCESEFSTEI